MELGREQGLATASFIALGAGLLALAASGACATTSDGYTDADSGIMTMDADGGGSHKDASAGDDASTGGGSKDSGTGGGDTDGTTPDIDAASCVKAPPSNMCGVAPQCGCPIGETCDVRDNMGDVQCISAGTAGQGKSCTTTAGCALGLTCGDGACRPYCPAGTADGAACGIMGTTTCLYAGTPAIPNFHVCRIACDLVNPSACDPTPAGGTLAPVGCDVDDKGNTDCVTAGAGTAGATCDGTNLCAPSYVCVNTGMTSVCKKWCKVGDNTPCGGMTCSGFMTKLMVNGAEYGACP
jgi:hypothetical protein